MAYNRVDAGTYSSSLIGPPASLSLFSYYPRILHLSETAQISAGH